MGTNQKHKIAILTDTGSYIYPKEAEELGIYLLPLQIVEDNKSYLDLFEIDTIDIYEKIYKENDYISILNVIECEAHRELLIRGLKNKMGDKEKNV